MRSAAGSDPLAYTEADFLRMTDLTECGRVHLCRLLSAMRRLDALW